jgi:hypothetical protein
MDGAGSSHPLRLMYISLSPRFYLSFSSSSSSSGFSPNEGPCYSWEEKDGWVAVGGLKVRRRRKLSVFRAEEIYRQQPPGDWIGN